MITVYIHPNVNHLEILLYEALSLVPIKLEWGEVLHSTQDISKYNWVRLGPKLGEEPLTIQGFWISTRRSTYRELMVKRYASGFPPLL